MFLEVDQVSIRYPRAHADAVSALSLQLPAGALGVLIGPSGSGKTSLLRAIAGLEQAASGRLLLDGRVLDGDGQRVSAEERRIGMVFQDFALFPHLDIATNVGFGLRHQSRAERRQTVEAMLTLVGLPDAHRKYPHQLSGGQQQRVALARALAPQPRLLLLDEPFSSLDVELRERLAADVREIIKRTGTTALMVTHDQMEAFAVGDLVGVMRDGKLEQWDAPYTLYHRPATRFVADFIGHGVLIDGHARRQGDGIEVDTAAGVLRGVPSPLAGDGEARPVEVLLRADDVIHDDDSSFKAQVVRKSFRGAEFLYTLELDSGQRLLSLVPSHHDHAIGEWIGIRLEVKHLVSFDARGVNA
ncbi:ABC transporter ATP-binding protein [Herbaspirillum sp. alder98]|uniref:ABC transporter ATP-binding protein n=1 Tax=Herbaspirillum sp. alder98 TaxID=2913096 RepID=UPI001CD90C4D|nr:ABC transporter ATP-binding protein [Herbaspirillum sp. alder98]MCA1323135.1 ABC transporter ATP-binding protein [Herbaspirillum sp. alder98]